MNSLVSGFWQFLVICVELALIGAIIFYGIDAIIEADARFKTIAKYAVGGALLLFFMFAIGAVFGLSGAAHPLVVTPISLLILGAAIIVLFLVVMVINIVVDRWGPEPARAIIKTIVGALAILVMLLVAADVLSGGSIQASFRRSDAAFANRSVAALSTGTRADLHRVLTV